MFKSIYYYIDKFNKDEIYKLNKSINIIYRNYSSSLDTKEISQLVNFCKKQRRKVYISNNLKSALKYNFDGVYIPSFNRSIKHLSYQLKDNFTILGSAHNIKEIRQKELQKVKLIFISSIFKENKNYLGLCKFNNLVKLSNSKIIALGGINIRNIKMLSLTNCFGFAGISYFKKK